MRIHLAQVGDAPDAGTYAYCVTVRGADTTRSRHQACISGWYVKLVLAVSAA